MQFLILRNTRYCGFIYNLDDFQIYWQKVQAAERHGKQRIKSIWTNRRFAVIFCMVCGFGIQGKGFLSETMRNFWIVSMVFLILLHIVSCIMFYRSRNHTLHMMTAIFPSIIFILTGLLEQDPPLLLFAIIFAIGKYIWPPNLKVNSVK